MLAQDDPEKSNTFVMTFKISGELNREVLANAVSQTLPLHPLVTSAINNTRDCWRVASLPHPIAEQLQPSDSFRFDLGNESGVRLALKSAPNKTQEFAVVVHHAVMDAIATIRFVEDIASAYTRLSGDKQASADTTRISVA